MADEIYLNLVRQFVAANNEFLPFAYVMLPACIISLDDVPTIRLCFRTLRLYVYILLHCLLHVKPIK